MLTSFTKATSTRLGTKSAEMWYLVATTGAKTMSVTITGATDEIKLSASSFTNITPTSPLDSVSVSTGSSGNPTISLTTGTANDLVVSTLHRHSTTDATTNRTSLYKNTSGSTLGASSYQLATSPASYSDTYTGSASQNWAMVSASFKPASGSTSTTTTYIHSDHLGSTNATTDQVGYTTKTLDYYPYGSERISTGSDTQQRTYIGQMYDPESSLSYLNARYYNPVTTQFLSQDPIFWRLPQDILLDPQQQNSYSYARNNPINRSDPTGLFSLKTALSGLASSLSKLVSSLSGYISNGGSRNSSGSSNGVVAGANNINQQNPTLPTATWDSVSDERIRRLDPRLRQPATNFINNTEKELDTKLRVTEGYRSIEDQNKLYNQSRSNPPTGPWVTNARGGESYHNYGRAIDVVVMENGQPNWNKPITQEIANIGIKQGFGWGGSWASPYTDPPHFEMTLGQGWQDLQASQK